MFALGYLIIAGMLVSMAAAPGWAADLVYQTKSSPQEGRTVVATSDGKALVRLRDMNNSNSIYYYHTALEIRRHKLAWLRKDIERRLVERRASELGITVDELLKREAPAQPVTDEMIARFLSQRGRSGRKITPEERKLLDDERKLAARRQYMAKLYAEAKIQFDIPEPEYPQVIVSEGNTSPVLGIDDGPVNVVEFCAFTSVPCKETWKALRELVQKYGWRVRIVHRDYPLTDAPRSMTAAIAARCAHRQGKFWPYHDKLYDNQDKLDDESLKKYARELKVDIGRFNQCFDNRETAQEIELDLWEGRRVQLNGLPSLFANTVYIPAGLAPEKLKELIEAQMGAR